MDSIKGIIKALPLVGLILAVILILYNIYTGATIHMISVPGVFEIEFDPSQADLKPKSTPLVAALSQHSTLEPDQFIRGYYEAINNRQYDQTWSLLSDNFKQVRNPTGKQDYIDYWNTIARVEIENIDVQNQTANTAVVAAAVHYTKRAGGTDRRTYTFTLVFDPQRAGWLIDWQE